MTTTLDLTKSEVAFLALYLGKAETRDKVCRAIQYGSKFISNGEPGTAATVDKNTSLARKVFRLLKTVNELNAFLAPAPKMTPAAIVFLQKSKNILTGTFFALDQVVWLGRSGIYKDKEQTDMISKISLYCWLAGNFCSSLAEIAELSRVALFIRKTERDLKRASQGGAPDIVVKLREQKKTYQEESKERTLSFIKATVDIFVAVGLIQLAPKVVTPRVTGALGLTTSLISCYQLLPPAPSKKKAAAA